MTATETAQSESPIRPDSPEARFRILQPGFATPEECARVIAFNNEFGKVGDGYDNPHPHTETEIYGGYSFAPVAKGDPAYEGHILCLELMKRARLLLKQHFGLPFLWLAYAHLVFRDPVDMAPKEGDLSHPWHYDNKSGRRRYRTHTAILYINDDFQGGQTCFRDHDDVPYREVRPQAGTLVGFRAAETEHAVTKVYGGRRHVLNMWFSTHIRTVRSHFIQFRPLSD